jgi:hypothetical protein
VLVYIEVVVTVTYVKNSIGVDVPKLHRVVYAQTEGKVEAQWQISYKDYKVNEWLKANCKHPYYHSPGYLTEKFIEFECDKEALLFAFRWQ